MVPKYIFLVVREDPGLSTTCTRTFFLEKIINMLIFNIKKM